MDDLDVFELFRLALGLVAPWKVTSVEFDQEGGTLQIGLDFPRGSRFQDSVDTPRMAAGVELPTVRLSSP